MPSIFSAIINGEIPAEFIWQDSDVVAFMDVNPQTNGHVLVVPRQEIDHWTDLPSELAAKVFAVAQNIAAVQKVAFGTPRIGLVIEGFAVPHAHIHIFPAKSSEDFDAKNKNGDSRPESISKYAILLRNSLEEAGYTDQVSFEQL